MSTPEKESFVVCLLKPTADRIGQKPLNFIGPNLLIHCITETPWYNSTPPQPEPPRHKLTKSNQKEQNVTFTFKVKGQSHNVDEPK